MSEKASKNKRKERGLNVRVVQEKKTTERSEVRVNSYSKKASTKSAKKAPKNTHAKKTKKKIKVIAEEKIETLSLNPVDKYVSKIIIRDVEKTRAEVEKPPVKVSDIKAIEKFNEDMPKPPVFPAAKKVVPEPPKISAKEIKDREIKKALNTASHLPETGKKRQRTRGVGNFGWARLTLMITCAATAIFALVYFMNLTSSDVSLKVAAAQSGIEATYPDYVPRGYDLSDVSSTSGKVTMSFKSEDGLFTISEETSSWDSTALLNNYIKENYASDEYSVVAEQGLTIYMGTNWEAWMNGGLLYKLEVKTGNLTKKQLKTIATSL